MAFVTDNKETILAIIDGWSENLSWLLRQTSIRIGLKTPPSRHHTKHDEIKHAFDLKKKSLETRNQLLLKRQNRYSIASTS